MELLLVFWLLYAHWIAFFAEAFRRGKIVKVHMYLVSLRTLKDGTYVIVKRFNDYPRKEIITVMNIVVNYEDGKSFFFFGDDGFMDLETLTKHRMAQLNNFHLFTVSITGSSVSFGENTLNVDEIEDQGVIIPREKIDALTREISKTLFVNTDEIVCLVKDGDAMFSEISGKEDEDFKKFVSFFFDQIPNMSIYVGQRNKSKSITIVDGKVKES